MQAQIDFITELATEYKLFAESPNELFRSLSEIPETTLRAIYDEYGGERNFQPVNLLRAEAARQLLDGAEVTQSSVEELKEKIRAKQIGFFEHLPSGFLRQFENYTIGKRDLFSSWQRHWNIFHTFFYRGETRETVQLYLNQICAQMLADLELPDYKFKWFDFRGIQNFGATRCWLALVPKASVSHKDAYQFFLGLANESSAGAGVGSNLEGKIDDDETTVKNYADAIELLKSRKKEITALNDEILQSRADEKTIAQNRKYFKFAPGEKASKWERFKEEGIAALSYDNLPLRDISEFTSREEMNFSRGRAARYLSGKIFFLISAAELRGIQPIRND